ncbi:unnamed protein product [Vicia faba]|uniref:S-protein homolog n=1 Tax=Vicia faba TaxID=3906 RepID=A0AAV0Z0Y5_VICFA|nr:unnamed protein product [Vicia faba]
MAYQNSITLKVLVLLIVLLGAEARDFEFFPKKTLIIRNDISPHPTPLDLVVHCKSKDDDLGFHTLAFGGTYSFQFRPKFFPIFGRTLFSCSFTWKGNPNPHCLNVYKQGVDDCKVCSWKINTTGGCNDFKGHEECRKWEGCI